jgi:hypothetical protein
MCKQRVFVVARPQETVFSPLVFWAYAVFLLVMSAGPSWAAPTTAEQARAVVTGWLSQEATPLGDRMAGATSGVAAYGDVDGTPAYYAVTVGEDGVVIVPGDDEVEPVIAFSSGGGYDPSETNPFGALVSNDVPGRVMAARQAADKTAASGAGAAQEKWARFLAMGARESSVETGIASVSDLRVSPLVASTWNQSTAGGVNTYNIYTPGNRVCGCVATAMSQLMRFHQHPASGVGTTVFNISICGSSATQALRGGDGAGGAYAWANMTLSPDASTSQTSRNAISALTADAGVSVNMDYCSSSGTDTLQAADAFKTTFGYSNAKKGLNGYANLPAAARNNMINPNLDAGYPALFGITGAGGHAIVVDGYGYNTETLYHHLNMGWGGSQDLWYNLPTIDTAYYNFNSVYKAVYNVYVSGGGEIISGRIVDADKNPIAGAVVTAVRTGGGSYTATTNSKGIYALAKVPSASTYTLSVSKSGYTFASTQVSTATSSDNTTTTGNLWGVDFTGAGVSGKAPILLLLWQSE